MSRRAKLAIRSQCWYRLTMASRMALPRRREGAARRASRQSAGGKGCRSCPPDQNWLGRKGLLRLLRQREEDDTGPDEVEVEVEVGNPDESAGHQERIEAHLCHLGIVGQVTVVRVPPPPHANPAQD